MREFGEGISHIYREMAETGLPAPVFKQDEFMLRATIKGDRTPRQQKDRRLLSCWQQHKVIEFKYKFSNRSLPLGQ